MRSIIDYFGFKRPCSIIWIALIFIFTASLMIFLQFSFPHLLNEDFYVKIADKLNSSCPDWNCLKAHPYHALFTLYLFKTFNLFSVDVYLNAIISSALIFALFITFAFVLCRNYKVHTYHSILLVLLLTMGSPGIWGIIWELEDNIYYYPFSLLITFFLVYSESLYNAENKQPKKLLLPLILIIATLTNFTNLVFGLLLLLFSIIVLFSDRKLSIHFIIFSLFFFIIGPTLYSLLFSQNPGGNPFIYYVGKAISWDQGLSRWSFPRFSPTHLEHYFYMIASLWNKKDIFLGGILASFFFLISCYGVYLEKDANKKLMLALLVSFTLIFPLLYETEVIERWDFFWFSIVLLTFYGLRKMRRNLLKRVTVVIIIYQVFFGVHHSVQRIKYEQNSQEDFLFLYRQVRNNPHKDKIKDVYLSAHFAKFDLFVRVNFPNAFNRVHYYQAKSDKYYFYRNKTYDLPFKINEWSYPHIVKISSSFQGPRHDSFHITR